MNVTKTNKILSKHLASLLVSMVAVVAAQIDYNNIARGLFGFTQLIAWLQTKSAALNYQLTSRYNFASLNNRIQNKTTTGALVKPDGIKPLTQLNYPVQVLAVTNHKAALATYKSFDMSKRNALLADCIATFAALDTIMSMVNQYKNITLCIYWPPQQQSKFILSAL